MPERISKNTVRGRSSSRRLLGPILPLSSGYAGSRNSDGSDRRLRAFYASLWNAVRLRRAVGDAELFQSDGL